MQNWTLLVSPWVIGEVTRNLPKLPLAATLERLRIRPSLTLVDDVASFDRSAVFPTSKDRPILLTASHSRKHY